MDEVPRISEQSDGEWSRRRVVTTGLLLLWSAPLITTFALADDKKKNKTCPPGKKGKGKGKCGK